MVTLTGNWLNPRSFTFSAEDAARHLGRLPRFGGTIDRWWTGLQHALLVSRLCTSRGPRVQLLGLHHDDAEVVTGDWCRPWKTPEVKRLQGTLDTAIAASIGLPEFTEMEHFEVKVCDDVACDIEAHLRATIVVERHPDSFGKRESAERLLAEGLFDGLGTGDLHEDFSATWNRAGHLVEMFLERHRTLMLECGMELRAAKAVSLPGAGETTPPKDDKEA